MGTCDSELDEYRKCDFGGLELIKENSREYYYLSYSDDFTSKSYINGNSSLKEETQALTNPLDSNTKKIIAFDKQTKAELLNIDI